jgi:hypothetical protein
VSRFVIQTKRGTMSFFLSTYGKNYGARDELRRMFARIQASPRPPFIPIELVFGLEPRGDLDQ